MVHINMLRNFLISVTDIKNAHTIFGPNFGSLRSKTVKKTETLMSDYVAISKQIKEKTKTIELAVDVMFVNKLPFVISIGKYMKFPTIENVLDQKAATLLKSLRSIKNVYTNKNIFITPLYMDKKIEVLRESLQDKGITLKLFDHG